MSSSLLKIFSRIHSEGVSVKHAPSLLSSSSLPPLLMPSHHAVSFPLPHVGCIAAAVLGEGSSLWMIKDAGTWITPARRCLVLRRLASSTVALALCCLGHVAPGLDLLHQHSSGKSCCWTCMQVSWVNEICVWMKDREHEWNNRCEVIFVIVGFPHVIIQQKVLTSTRCTPCLWSFVVSKWTKPRLRSPPEFNDSCDLSPHMLFVEAYIW